MSSKDKEHREGSRGSPWSLPPLTCWVFYLLLKMHFDVLFYFYHVLIIYIFKKKNANTHFPIHSLWLVKIHMGPTKSCGSHINLVGPMWILTNQRECWKMCVKMCVASISLLKDLHFSLLIIDYNISNKILIRGLT